MLRRWATASRKFMLEAIVGCLLLLLVVLPEDVKVRRGVVDVIVKEIDEGMTVLVAREALSGLYARRPLSSSGAVIAMARTRRARRTAVFVRIICCKV